MPKKYQTNEIKIWSVSLPLAKTPEVIETPGSPSLNVGKHKSNTSNEVAFKELRIEKHQTHYHLQQVLQNTVLVGPFEYLHIPIPQTTKNKWQSDTDAFKT